MNMEFITSKISNLCLFCYKIIPPDNQIDTKVNKFCANLARLLGFQSFKVKPSLSSLSSCSFASCEDCKVITTQFSEIYHEIKCLELELLWKLETLRKVMNYADKLPLRVAHMKQFLSDSFLHAGAFQADLEAFRTFRTKIKNKCNDGRKLSMYQPRVSLQRMDSIAQISTSHKLYDGSDELNFDVVTANQSLYPSIERIPQDIISEHLYLDDNQEADEELLDMNKDTHSITCGPAVISNNMLDTIKKIEVAGDSNLFLDDEEYDNDHFNSTPNLHVVPCKMFNCKRRFKNIEELMRHQMLDHPEQNMSEDYSIEKPFSCQQCGKSFKGKANLRLHLEFHKNPAEWKYKCLICGKRCALKAHLRKHMTSHTDERNHECKLCGKTFKMIEYLRTHLKSHRSRDEWKFECSFCGRKCIAKQDLERHLLVHSNARPFKCKICKKGFKSNHFLRGHLRVHGNPEDWKDECGTCGKNFANKVSLKYHMRVHTSEKFGNAVNSKRPVGMKQEIVDDQP